MCLGMFILVLILHGTLGASWTRMAISFQMLGTFLIESPQIFSQYCFFLSSSSICIWVCLILSQRSLRWSLFILSLSLFGFASFIHHSIFQITYPFFSLNFSAIGFTQCIFNLSNSIAHCKLLFLLGLVNRLSYLLDMCIQSIYLSLYFIFKTLDQLYYHYSEFFFRQNAYFLFISLSCGCFHVPSSATRVSASSFCLIYCVLCLLYVSWKITVLNNCGVCPPRVGLDQCLVKISWLGGLLLVFRWIKVDPVSLKGSACQQCILGCLCIWYGFGQPVC